jgi:hypothetical protein
MFCEEYGNVALVKLDSMNAIIFAEMEEPNL